MFRVYLNLITGIAFLIFCYCAYLYEQQRINKPVFSIIVLIIVGIVGVISIVTKKIDTKVGKSIHQKYDENNNRIDPKIVIFIACFFVSLSLYKLSGMWHYLLISLFSICAIVLFIIKAFKNNK